MSKIYATFVPYCARRMYTEDGTHFAVLSVQSPLEREIHHAFTFILILL
jgi:hypothetical protein